MSTDTPHKGLRREPKAVTKPRVGNPWREALHGPVGVPVMRVRGGAGSGMPVPSWQADGSPREPRELPADGAPELPSIVRAYGGAAPVLVSGVALRVSPDVEASRLYPAMRPAASVAEDRADDAWQTTPDKCAAMREEHAVRVWERLYCAALSNGHASWESIPVHPSIVAERTRALQSREAPSYVVVRALPASPMAHDPGHQTRAILASVAPVKGHRYRVRPGLPSELSALSALIPDKVDAREGVSGGLYRHKGDAAAAVAPCAWCDSVACDRARDESLHCKVYDRAVSRKLPEALAYVAAREAFKGPRRAYRAAMDYIDSHKALVVASLRALDARGVNVDDRAMGVPSDSLQGARWRDSGVQCAGYPVKAMVRNHPSMDYGRVDACHTALATLAVMGDALASASAGGVEAASEALSMVAAFDPWCSGAWGWEPLWWREELPRWRATRDAHNGASIRLVQALRASRDTTVARVVPSQWEDTVKRVVRPSPDGSSARASSVVAAPREGIARSRLPAPAPLKVAPLYGPFQAPDVRQWGDRPEYPVAPRDRTTADPSTVSPVPSDGRYYRDPSIEELSQRARRP